MRKRKIDDVIRRALKSELEKMQDNNIYTLTHPPKINDWSGAALASWIAPGVIRAVTLTLSPPPKPRRKK